MTAATPASQISPEKRAEIKQSLKEKLNYELGNKGSRAHAEGSDAALVAMKAEAVRNAGIIKEPAKMKIAQATNLSSTIAELGKFEFVTRSAGGQIVLAQGRELKKHADGLTLLVTKLDESLAQLDRLSGQEMSLPLGRYAVREDFALTEIEAIARTLEELGSGAQAMLEDKAIEAWVAKNPDAVSKFTAILEKLGDGALKTATEGVPPPFKPLAGVATLLKGVLDNGINLVNEARQIAKYKQLNVKGSGFSYLDEEPAAIASMVAENWKSRFSLLLTAAGVVANQIPGWSFISDGIESVADGYFDGRVKKLEEALEKAKAAKAAKPQGAEESGGLSKFLKETCGDIAGELKDSLIEAVGAMQIPDLATVGDLGQSAVKALLTDIVAEIVKRLPIDPAQAVDGAALRTQVASIAKSSVWTTEYHQKGEAQKPDHVAPAADKDGNPIEMIVSSAKETDDKGDYLWVRIGGKLGKLHLDGLEFDDTAQNEELARIPTKDDRGRTIDEVRAGLDGGKYVARIKDVWGHLDPVAPFTFTATRPDDSAYADWSGRVVSKTGYTEGGTPVTGKWYQPWPGKYAFLLVRDDGTREWAQATDLTGNVPGSREYSIGAMVPQFVVGNTMDGPNEL